MRSRECFWPLGIPAPSEERRSGPQGARPNYAHTGHGRVLSRGLVREQYDQTLQRGSVRRWHAPLTLSHLTRARESQLVEPVCCIEWIDRMDDLRPRERV